IALSAEDTARDRSVPPMRARAHRRSERDVVDEHAVADGVVSLCLGEREDGELREQLLRRRALDERLRVAGEIECVRRVNLDLARRRSLEVTARAYERARRGDDDRGCERSEHEDREADDHPALAP